MGAGSRMSSTEERFEDEKPRGGHDPLHRVPTAIPPFTLGDIKKAVPPHCFRRSALRSFSYVAQDLAVVAGLLYLATSFLPLLPSPLHLLAWPLYWAAQGCVLGGLWVLAHECGHHAFSDSSLLDDAVGFLLHSALLVPYFSWKYSHPALPHYDSSEWDWLRGALATVDRDYGVLNTVFHHITDTHVVHHLFSTIPHYHAVEATRAIRPILGDYYLSDETPVYRAIWREAKECLDVAPDEVPESGGVFWYRNKF